MQQQYYYIDIIYGLGMCNDLEISAQPCKKNPKATGWNSNEEPTNTTPPGNLSKMASR